MLRRSPERTGVLTDFDGTLAELVDDPAAARPLPGSVDVLGRLVRRYGLVGVVSGRPVSFLADHLRVSGLWISGLYGLEAMVDGEIVEVAEAAPWREVVRAAVVEAAGALPSLLVEDKGMSMTVHFRTTPGRERDARSWAERMASTSGLVVREAKASIELHPPVVADKGSVIETKVHAHGGLDTVCFLGDDRGDLSAFGALARLRGNGMQVVRVGVATPETPDALLAQADVVVDGPAGALAFLTELLVSSTLSQASHGHGAEHMR